MPFSRPTRRAARAVAAVGAITVAAVLVTSTGTVAGFSDSKGVPSNGVAAGQWTWNGPGAAAAYDRQVKELKPAGYWKMDEAVGSAMADSSGNGLNGTYYDRGDLRYTAADTGWTSSVNGGNAYVYDRFNVPAAYTVAAGDRLEYDIYIESGSRWLGVDLTTSGPPLRDMGYTDQDGVPAHPQTPSGQPELPTGQWNHRIITFASGTPMVGLSITEFALATENNTAAPNSARFSDILISDSAGNAKATFWKPGDPVPSATLTQSTSATPSVSLTAGMMTPQVTGALTNGVAMRFSGSGSHAEVSAASLDMASTDGFTVEAWVNTTYTPGAGTLACRQLDGSGGEQYCLDIDSHAYAGQARFFVVKSNGTIVWVHGPVITDGNWHHVVGVRNAGSLSIYVDGVLAEQKTGTSGTLNAPAGAKVMFGSRTDPLSAGGGRWPNGLDGGLGEVAIYKTALTPAQILQHYRLRSYEQRVLALNPLAYWKLDEASAGSQMLDSSGNGFHGTYLSDGPQVTPRVSGAMPGGVGAMGFPGSAARGEANHVELDMTNATGLTVEAWVRTDRVAEQNIACRVSSFGGGEQYCLETRVDGTAWFMILTGGSAGAWLAAWATTPFPADGEWHHLVGVLAGDTVSIYLDGVLKQQVPGASPGPMAPVNGQAATSMRIGARPENGSVWREMRGSIDEVAIYAFALTPAQIADHANVR